MALLRRLVPILTIGYWIAMFVATHLPSSRLPKTQVGDKTEHVVGYAILAGLLCVSLWLRRPEDRRVPWIVLAAALAYATFDELTQPLVGRVADPVDWVADAAGAALAVLLFVLLRDRFASSAVDEPAVGKRSHDQ